MTNGYMMVYYGNDGNLFQTNAPWYLIFLSLTGVLTVKSHLEFVKFTADMLTLHLQ